MDVKGLLTTQPKLLNTEAEGILLCVKTSLSYHLSLRKKFMKIILESFLIYRKVVKLIQSSCIPPHAHFLLSFRSDQMSRSVVSDSATP